MRNLKKILAVICVVAMLASMLMVPALAATTFTYEAEATTLNTLGLMAGMNLGDAVTRIQGLTFAIKAAGKNAEAQALTDAEVAVALANVNDAAQIPAWGVKYAAYAVLNALTTGTDATIAPKIQFSPLQEVSGDSMLVWILKSMGYTTVGTVDAWQIACTNAKVLSLTQGYAFHGKAALIRDDVAGILFGAAKNGLNKDGKTFIQSLIDAGFITQQAAADAGLVTPPSAAPLAVTSVDATNLVEVIVTFNKPIDKDSIADGDFAVDGTDVLDDDVSLSDDKTVATLTVPPMSNGDEISIEVSGVNDASGTEMSDYEDVFTPMDSQQPTVKSIEFTGPETAKLSLSEPIDETGSAPEIIIDGGIYSASPEPNYDGKKDITINLGTELDEGSHTFKVKGFEDFAGYSNFVTTLNVNYAAIDTAPAVSVKEATQSYVILKFERPVTDIEVADFYQTYSTWKPLEVQKEDGKTVLTANDWTDTVRLAFTDAQCVTKFNSTDDDKPLPVGTAKIVVKDEAVYDHWDNKIDGDVVLSATITADTDKPTISKVSVESEKEVRVYFSEDVVAGDAEDESNYVIKDKDGKVVSPTKWHLAYNDTDNYVAILFTSNLDKGDYTVTVEAIADTSISANSLDTVTESFTITDKSVDIATTVAAWVDGSKIIYVKYPDTMATSGAGSVLDKANYRLDGAKLGDSVKLTMFTAKIVKMQFPSAQVDLVLDPADPDYVVHVLTIGVVKDAADNIVSGLATPVTITDEQAPKIITVKKIATNKFELTVDQELKSISSGAIQVDADGAGPLVAANASYRFANDGDDTKITITVPDTHKSASTEAVTTSYAITIAVGKINSQTGVSITPVTIVAGGALGDFTDGVAPEVAKLDDDKVIYAYDSTDADNLIDSIIIKYSEAINPGTVSKYTYTVDGYDVKAATVVNLTDMDTVRGAIDVGTLTSAAGKYVVLTLKELDDGTTNDTDGAPGVTQKYSIEDGAGNALAAQDSVDAISAADADSLNP